MKQESLEPNHKLGFVVLTDNKVGKEVSDIVVKQGDK